MIITPVYATFEQAKWLKEKGFGLETKTFYASNGKVCDGVYAFDDWCFRPEQHVVVEWLRVNHGIWISVFHKRHSENKHYGYLIKQSNGIKTKLWEFTSPQEAYSAAFDCIKEKGLI